MAVSSARSKLYLSSSAFPTPGHEGLSYLYGSLYVAEIYGRGEMNQIGGRSKDGKAGAVRAEDQSPGISQRWAGKATLYQ